MALAPAVSDVEINQAEFSTMRKVEETQSTQLKRSPFGYRTSDEGLIDHHISQGRHHESFTRPNRSLSAPFFASVTHGPSFAKDLRSQSDGDIQQLTSHNQDWQIVHRPDSVLKAPGDTQTEEFDYGRDRFRNLGPRRDLQSDTGNSIIETRHSYQVETFPQAYAYNALHRAATLPSTALVRPQSHKFRTVAYCARCFFWLEPSWAQAEALVKNVSFVDPDNRNLDERGCDGQGHLRINQQCCPVCEQHRHVTKNSPNKVEEAFLMEQLDRIIDIWVSKGLIEGMTSGSMAAKESMKPRTKMKHRKKRQDPFVASLSGAGKKVRDLGLPVGVWDAMELGFELAAELLEAV